MFLDALVPSMRLVPRSATRAGLSISFALVIGTSLVVSRKCSASDYVKGAPEVIVARERCTGMPLLCADDDGHVYSLFVRCTDLFNEFDVLVARSMNFGRDWELPVVIESLPGRAQVASGGADLQCDSFGNVFAAWGNPTVGWPDIYFVVSHDAGASWNGPPVRLSSSEPGTSDNAKPRIAHDGLGNVYVGWFDGGQSRSPGAYFNVSHDFGDTWRALDIRLNEMTQFAEQIQVACDDLGHVYVLYVAGIPDAHNLWLSVSSDFGETFAPEVRVNPFDTQPGFGYLATDGNGHVVVGYNDSRRDPVGQSRDVFVNVSSDFGQSFRNEDIRVSHAGLGGLRMSCNGVVYALVPSSRGSGGFKAQLFFNRSLDYALTWQPDDIQLSARVEDVTDWDFTSTRGGHVYVVWSYFTREIMLNASVDDGATWLPAEMRMDTVGDNGGVAIAADELGNVYTAWDTIAAMAEIRANWASPLVQVGMEGPNDPVRIPPEGSSFEYEVLLRNTLSSRQAGLSAWIDVTKPNGRTFGPVLGPVSFSLGADVERGKTLRLRVPARVPPGTYLLNLRISGPMVGDQNRLCLLKE